MSYFGSKRAELQISKVVQGQYHNFDKVIYICHILF